MIEPERTHIPGHECCVMNCHNLRFLGFYVCEAHAEETTEPALLRTIAWG